MLPGRAWFLIAALPSCWKDTTTHASAAQIGSVGACPYVVRNYLGESWLWSHELFPGCPPAPFGEEVGCGRDCPMPCLEQDMRDSVALHTIRYSYARGHLVASDPVGGDERPYFAPVRCTYVGDALARCTTPRGSVVVHRDGGGRIVRIEEPNGSLAITYDARGDATDFVVHGDERVTHLAGVDTIAVTLAFDDKHRLVQERDSGETITYTYARTGELLDHAAVRRDYDPTSGVLLGIDSSLSLTTFTYDDRRRPIRIARRTGGARTATWPFRTYGPIEYERVLDYDCPDSVR